MVSQVYLFRPWVSVQATMIVSAGTGASGPRDEAAISPGGHVTGRSVTGPIQACSF